MLSTFLKDCCCSREQLHPCSICGLAPVFLTSKITVQCTGGVGLTLFTQLLHTDISIRCTKLALQGEKNIQGRKKNNSPDKRQKNRSSGWHIQSRTAVVVVGVGLESWSSSSLPGGFGTLCPFTHTVVGVDVRPHILWWVCVLGVCLGSGDMSVGGEERRTHTRRRRRRRGGGGWGGKWVVVRRIKTLCAFSPFKARELANASECELHQILSFFLVCGRMYYRLLLLWKWGGVLPIYEIGFATSCRVGGDPLRVGTAFEQAWWADDDETWEEWEEEEEQEFFRLLHCSPFSSSVYCSQDVEASFVDWLLCVLSSVTLSLYICFLVCRTWGPGFLFTVFRYLGGDERDRDREQRGSCCCRWVLSKLWCSLRGCWEPEPWSPGFRGRHATLFFLFMAADRGRRRRFAVTRFRGREQAHKSLIFTLWRWFRSPISSNMLTNSWRPTCVRLLLSSPSSSSWSQRWVYSSFSRTFDSVEVRRGVVVHKGQ